MAIYLGQIVYYKGLFWEIMTINNDGVSFSLYKKKDGEMIFDVLRKDIFTSNEVNPQQLWQKK